MTFTLPDLLFAVVLVTLLWLIYWIAFVAVAHWFERTVKLLSLLHSHSTRMKELEHQLVGLTPSRQTGYILTNVRAHWSRYRDSIIEHLAAQTAARAAVEVAADLLKDLTALIDEAFAQVARDREQMTAVTEMQHELEQLEHKYPADFFWELDPLLEELDHCIEHGDYENAVHAAQVALSIARTIAEREGREDTNK